MPIQIVEIKPATPLELKITWEGEAPGVADHRLSISAFGDALKELLKAYRRIASNMLRDAAGYAERGRLNELANLLDIEIAQIEGSSVELSAVCTFRPPPDPQANLFFPGDILERAGKELLDSIDEESKGHPYNTSVRNYLSALPSGLTRQQYELSENGKVLHAPVVIGPVSIAATPLLNLPYLIEFTGSVTGVGFEPGVTEVRVRTEEDERLRFLAPVSLVEQALELRGKTVRGLAVKAKEMRLLRLSDATAPAFVLTRALEEDYLFGRWDALLRRLAQ
jgi:hypothetical protein